MLVAAALRCCRSSSVCGALTSEFSVSAQSAVVRFCVLVLVFLASGPANQLVTRSPCTRTTPQRSGFSRPSPKRKSHLKASEGSEHNFTRNVAVGEILALSGLIAVWSFPERLKAAFGLIGSVRTKRLGRSLPLLHAHPPIQPYAAVPREAGPPSDELVCTLVVAR